MKPMRIAAAVLLLLVVAATGQAGACRNCGLVFPGDGVYCAQCSRRFEVEADRAAKEVTHVERLAKARQEYDRAVEDLIKYYLMEGQAEKVANVRREQEALTRVPRYDYLSLAELRSPNLTPSKSIAEADTLFQEGLRAVNERTPLFGKREPKYRRAIEKFTDLVKKYPESDKIDDAAFYLGQCYSESVIAEYQHALLWYERCHQWNPNSGYEPRYHIARIYDKELGDREKAIENYNLVLRDHPTSRFSEKSQRRITALGGRTAFERTQAVERKF